MMLIVREAERVWGRECGKSLYRLLNSVVNPQGREPRLKSLSDLTEVDRWRIETGLV